MSEEEKKQDEPKKFLSFTPNDSRTIFFGPDGEAFLVLDPVNGMVLKGDEPVKDTQGVYWAFCEWMSRSGVKIPATPFIEIIDKQASALANESSLVQQLMQENQILKKRLADSIPNAKEAKPLKLKDDTTH